MLGIDSLFTEIDLGEIGDMVKLSMFKIYNIISIILFVIEDYISSEAYFEKTISFFEKNILIKFSNNIFLEFSLYTCLLFCVLLFQI